MFVEPLILPKQQADTKKTGQTPASKRKRAPAKRRQKTRGRTASR